MSAAAFLIALLAVTPPPASGAEAAASAEPARFGKPLRDLAPVALADVLAKPEDGRAVRLTGTVEAVCRNKGCWMTLKDGDQRVHVTFEGYSFFLPRDAATKKATLEGKVVVKDADPAELAHLKSEGASDSAGARVTVEAYGVELR